MTRTIVTANSKTAAAKKCKQLYGWTPDAIRKVDSGEKGKSAYMCFESARDAEMWDKQR